LVFVSPLLTTLLLRQYLQSGNATIPSAHTEDDKIIGVKLTAGAYDELFFFMYL
jgi:hypothetical protein